MSILTLMFGIPLYSTQEEALAWASANSIGGYHTHNFQGQIGYMGGADHSTAIQAVKPAQTTTTQTSTPSPPTISSGTGGGGGY